MRSSTCGSGLRTFRKKECLAASPAGKRIPSLRYAKHEGRKVRRPVPAGFPLRRCTRPVGCESSCPFGLTIVGGLQFKHLRVATAQMSQLFVISILGNAAVV